MMKGPIGARMYKRLDEGAPVRDDLKAALKKGVI